MIRSFRSILRRPSPAMLVALAALFVALGSSGYAARLLPRALFAKRAGNADKVDGLSASRNPRPHRLLALNSRGKFPASVGLTGPQGPAGPQGATGEHGNLGAPGSAVAFSFILNAPPDGGVLPVWRADDSFSKRIDNDVNFTRQAAGVYCFHDLPFTPLNAVASAGKLTGAAFFVQAEVARAGSPLTACPANSGAAVYVTDATGTLDDPPNDADTIYVAFN